LAEFQEASEAHCDTGRASDAEIRPKELRPGGLIGKYTRYTTLRSVAV